MAEVVQIDIPGIGLVEARNAASEKTLSEILKILEGYNKGGGGAGGVGGAGKSGGSGKREKDNAGGGAGGPGTFGKSVNFLTSKITFVAGSFVQLGEESIKAVSNLASLGDSLESVANLFSGIPIAGAMFSAVASASERVSRAFNDVAQSGATFNGSLNSFAGAASQAGMTLSEFGSLIRSNGQGMLAFGGTVESGAKRFADVSKQLRATGSGLYALGMSTQEINKGLAAYGEMQRLQGMQGRKSNADLVAGASRYLKNLDALAKITGEERAAKEAEMKALLQSAQFQAAMAGLSEEVRESFMMTVGQLPKGMQKFAEDIMATGTATTEENQKLLAMMPQSAALLTEFHAKQQRGEAITLEERNRLNNLMKQEGGAALQSIKQAGAANAELAPLVNSLSSTYQINTDAVKEATEEQKAAQAATDKVNETINKMRERIAAVSNSFTMLLVNSGALSTMMNMFEGLVSFITTFVIPVFDFMVKVVNQVATVIGKIANIVLPILSATFERISEILKNIYGPIIDRISRATESVTLKLEDFKGAIDFVDKLMVEAFGIVSSIVKGATTAFESLWDNVQSLIDPLKNLWDSVTNLFGAVYDLFGGTTNLQKIFLEVGQVIGEVFSILAAVVSPIIGLFSSLFNSTAEVIRSSEFLRTAISTLSQVISESWTTFRKYFSVEGFKSIFEDIADGFMGFIDKLWNLVPNALGGLSNEEYAEREKLRKERAEARELRLQGALDEKDKRNEATNAIIEDEKKNLREKGLYNQANERLARRELGAREAAAKAAEKQKELELGDPYSLLKGLAEKEGSEFVKNAETPRRTMENEAEKKRADENRRREEQQRQQQQPGSTPTPNQTPPNQAQETMIAAINKLNTNIEQMVAHQARTISVLNNQLRIQENMAGNMTVDLFGA